MGKLTVDVFIMRSWKSLVLYSTCVCACVYLWVFFQQVYPCHFQESMSPKMVKVLMLICDLGKTQRA